MHLIRSLWETFIIIDLLYFCLHWVFAALELSLVVASGGYSLVAVCELLIVVASLVAVLGLYVHGLQYSSCRSQA